MTEQKLTKLYHPTVRGSEVEVAASQVARWTDQGWRKTKPDLSNGGVAAAAPAAKKAAAPSRAARKRAAAAKKATAPKPSDVLHPGAG